MQAHLQNTALPAAAIALLSSCSTVGATDYLVTCQVESNLSSGTQTLRVWDENVGDDCPLVASFEGSDGMECFQQLKGSEELRFAGTDTDTYITVQTSGRGAYVSSAGNDFVFMTGTCEVLN
ncbi:hypothetical protein shim_08360 [Shimia sp. SK013]|uniref:hypothetical protein n=1 Tax=Shimia sp. SK013 TaxID=1389006 RepID=UPI0006CDC07D|nr:hypothetical protein [Shimia sp. SK013]KPA22550.1 hypothetical protein shim_08360 [Shimia sp. SK013]